MEMRLSNRHRFGVFISTLIISTTAVGQMAEIGANTAAREGTSAISAKPMPARLNAAAEAWLKVMIAQHQRVRSRLSTEDQALLDELTIQVKSELFAAPLQGNLLVSATQAVNKMIPSLTKSEATILAEYVLGGIASSIETRVSTASSRQADLVSTAESIQEAQASFNIQYLEFQQQMQNENRQYTLVSNIMKNKHDTVKNSINNIR